MRYAPSAIMNSDHVPSLGQVVALFLVGLGEYFVVWLGTDWEKQVQKGVERNNRGTIGQGYATFE